MGKKRAAARAMTTEELAFREGRTAHYVGLYRGEGTQANRRCVLRQYEEFCGVNNFPAWPVEERVVGLFISQWADRNESAKVDGLVSTLRTEAREVHRQEFDTFLESYLYRLRVGLRKVYGMATKRKLPLTLDRLETVLPCINLGALDDLQLITMAYVAHDTLLRGCELMALQWEDIMVYPDNTWTVRVKRSKMSLQEEMVPLAPYERHGVVFCGASLLGWYVQLVRETRQPPGSEFLFLPQVQNRKAAKQLFVDTFQAKLRAAGLSNVEDYSGHSFRAGGATDLFEGGAPPRIIQLTGRWRSDAYLLYIRDHWYSRAQHVSRAFSCAPTGPAMSFPGQGVAVSSSSSVTNRSNKRRRR